MGGSMSRKIFMMLTVILLMNSVFAGDLDSLIEQKINKIINQMTLKEKVAMLGGDTTSFDSKPLPRLGIPVLRMTDGPNGVRWGKSTAFPVGVCIAATWDTSLIYQLGQALGRETKAQGRNVLLGPCVNIHRDPRAGRNFESYGEDPYLAASTAVAFIKGLQSENVIATTKHFACNNQEFERSSMDSRVDERTLHEIYLPAFKAAVQEGHTWAIMSSYNRLNGQYASSNTWLLQNLLKDTWGFKGFVMSDWGAVHSVVPTMYAGLDIEMPNGRYMSVENVIQAIHEGRMKITKVDDKIRRMLRAIFAMGLFENEIPAGGALHSDENIKVAYDVAAGGMVLLKNEGNLLPFTKEKIKSLAVIGPNAGILRTGGGGSSRVEPINPTSPDKALTQKAGGISITYSPGMIVDSDLKPIPEEYLQTPCGKSGLLGEYFNNAEFSGDSVEKRIDKTLNYNWGPKGPDHFKINYFSIRWTGKLTVPESGKYLLGTTSDDGTRLYIDGEMVVDNWGDHAMGTRVATVDLKKDKPAEIRIDFYEHGGDAGVILQWQKVGKPPLDEAVKLAQEADAVVLFVGFTDRDESEGFDRNSNALSDEQVALIKKIKAANKNLAVVLNSGAGILMNDWAADAPAIVQAWYPGEEGGNAIADILLGNVNPSGKLVTTFFNKETDLPTINNYPGEDDELNYEEGIFVGYRHYDKNNIAPLFPFGHGLSYTNFEYGDLKLTKTVHPNEAVTVSLKVKNTGPVNGAEVVQLYLGDNQASVIRPVKELKSYAKVFLKAGEEKEVALNLSHDAMKFWDVCTDSWKAEPGKFTIFVGSSSRDIRLRGNFILK